jgi:CRISPR-associated endoribonuclease Cas6
MRIKVILSTDKPILLSSAYNRAVQGLIYSLLEEDFSNTLHDIGYRIEKRAFKLFTFSRLFGRFARKGDVIEFDKKVTLFISSPVEKIIEQISKALLKGAVQLETNKLQVESIEFVKKPLISSPMTVRTLSPITVYSTLYSAEGSKKTYYYSPFEKEFVAITRSNLMKKAKVLNVNNNGNFELEPAGRQEEIFLSFKGTLIRGWIGTFKLTGDQDLISVGYEAGFGNKNSAGFGMIEVLKNA